MKKSNKKLKSWIKSMLYIFVSLIVLFFVAEQIYGKLVLDQLSIDISELAYNNNGIIIGAEPFELETINISPSQDKIACLLVHGYCDSPATWKLLAEKLAEKGYDYRAILLPGHGTRPYDLAPKRWTDWFQSVQTNYEELKKKYNKVFVVGFSTGGTTALRLAEIQSVDGIILVAPFLRITPIAKIQPEVIFSGLSKLFLQTKYLKKIGQPGFVDLTLRSQFIDYRYMPVASTQSLFEFANIVSQDITKIICPILILHGKHDKSSDPQASKLLFDTVSSEKKQLVYFEKSSHVLIMDKEREDVFKEITKTLEMWENRK